MGRFSPSIQPTPSWTNGLAEGIQNIGDALMQRRQFNQQRNQQDIANAENGVYRGQAPRGTLNITTPDFIMRDPVQDPWSEQPSVNRGPQVQQMGDYSAQNSGSRPLPGGISALNPMTDALLQGRAQSQTGGIGATFNGPDGKGLVDTQRYQQVNTASGSPFYLDREQTPDAQALRRSVLSGEMGLNKALMVGTLRNAGLIANTDERNAAYAPGGAHYQYNQDAINAKQQFVATQKQLDYGYVDPTTGKYTPGRVATGKTFSGAPALQERQRHDQATEAAANTRNAVAGQRAVANSPQQKQLSAVQRQTALTNSAIGQDQHQLADPMVMGDTAQTRQINQHMTSLQARRDSLTNVADSISHVMQQPTATAPASTSGIEKDGHAASTVAPSPQGLAQPKHPGSGHAKQELSTSSNTLPAGPTAPTAPARAPLDTKSKTMAKTNAAYKANLISRGYQEGTDF